MNSKKLYKKVVIRLTGKCPVGLIFLLTARYVQVLNCNKSTIFVEKMSKHDIIIMYA